MSPVQVKSGSVYTFPACTFTPPSGKVFRGWLLSGHVYHTGETITVTGNMQLYAQWQENPDNVYTLTFDGNGLTGSMPSIKVKSGETVTLRSFADRTVQSVELLGVGPVPFEQSCGILVVPLPDRLPRDSASLRPQDPRRFLLPGSRTSQQNHPTTTFRSDGFPSH